jgi:hypothetical protein
MSHDRTSSRLIEAAFQQIANPVQANADPQPKYRRVEDIPALESIDFGAQRWVVPGILPVSSIVLWAGEPGCGKTTLAVGVGAHVSVGAPFMGRETERRPVLILDRENPGVTMQERLQRLGIKCHDRFRVWGGWLDDEAPDPASPIVMEFILGSEPRPLIVLDSLVAFAKCDENSSTEMRRYLDRLRKVAQLGASLLVLHHSGKAATSKSYRGSSDIAASIDVGARLENLSSGANWERVSLNPFKARVQVDGNLLIGFDELTSTFCDLGERQLGMAQRDVLLKLLRDIAGCSCRDFELEAGKLGIPRYRARKFINSNDVRRVPAGRGSFALHPVDSEGLLV